MLRKEMELSRLKELFASCGHKKDDNNNKNKDHYYYWGGRRVHTFTCSSQLGSSLNSGLIWYFHANTFVYYLHSALMFLQCA